MEKNIAEMFIARAAQFGARDALLYKKDGAYHSISWLEFAERVRFFALGLHALGVKAGETVCLLSENRPEWAIADLAILSLGAVNVPLYATNAYKDIVYVARHSGAKILILSTNDQYEKIKGLRSEVGVGLQRMVCMDKVPASDPAIKPFRAVEEQGKRIDQAQPGFYGDLSRRVQSDDLASLIYTSGTTGEPKGVMLTHGNFLSNVEAAAHALPVSSRDTALSFLPLSHVFERMAGFYFMIHFGVAIAYAENMNTVPENLCEIKPTVVTAVPRFYEKVYGRIMEKLAQAPPLRKKIFSWALSVGRKSIPYRLKGLPMPAVLSLSYRLAGALVFAKLKASLGGRIRFFISGGAPLPPEIAEFFYAADVLILEGYGLTETSPVVAVNRPGACKFGSVGPLLPGVKVKIAADGEILIQGPNIMQGYYKNPKETEAVFKDGWFATGDIGRMDADGFLYITDRKKDLIITSGGKNIAPQKIEGLLSSDEAIQQICVIGDRRNYLCALIVPRFTELERFAREKGVAFSSRRELLDHAEIKEWIRLRIEERSNDLAGYEKIKCFVLLGEEFTQDKGELTPTLKLKRRVVLEKYKTLIDSMYA